MNYAFSLTFITIDETKYNFHIEYKPRNLRERKSFCTFIFVRHGFNIGHVVTRLNYKITLN